nr:hypothetical protein [Tanacetum cinerariifolium]
MVYESKYYKSCMGETCNRRIDTIIAMTRFKHSSHSHWSTCIVMSSITLDGYVTAATLTNAAPPSRHHTFAATIYTPPLPCISPPPHPRWHNHTDTTTIPSPQPPAATRHPYLGYPMAAAALAVILATHHRPISTFISSPPTPPQPPQQIQGA